MAFLEIEIVLVTLSNDAITFNAFGGNFCCRKKEDNGLHALYHNSAPRKAYAAYTPPSSHLDLAVSYLL